MMNLLMNSMLNLMILLILLITWVKSIDDVDDCGFIDEISSTEIAYLAKNIRNFQRNNNRRARNRNNADPKNVKKNETTKKIILKNQKIRLFNPPTIL